MMCRVYDLEAGMAASARHRRKGEMVCQPCRDVLARERAEQRNTQQCVSEMRFGGQCAKFTSHSSQTCFHHRKMA